MTWWAEGDWPEHGYWVKVVLLRDNPEGDTPEEKSGCAVMEMDQITL